MAAILITCRITGQDVYTGIDMDEDTFANIPNVPMQTHCPHCGGNHVWWTRQAHLGSRPIYENAAHDTHAGSPSRQTR